MAASTVGNCITRAVELAQLDSSFLDLAREYYNMIMIDMSTSERLPYFRTQASDVPMIAGQVEYDLPDDWSRSDTCYLIDSNNNRKEIVIKSKYFFDRLQRPDVTSGDPRLAYVDISRKKIVFDASPSAARSFRLTYFRKAVEIDETGANDSDDIDFESPLFVTYKIAAMLMDYNDDTRAPQFDAEAEKILAKMKMFGYDEDNDSKIELAPSFRPGRRPTRSGGGGFFSW